MKKKALFLKKEVIADLSSQEMRGVIGGNTMDKKSCECPITRPDENHNNNSIIVMCDTVHECGKGSKGCSIPEDTVSYVNTCPLSEAHFGCPPPITIDY